MYLNAGLQHGTFRHYDTPMPQLLHLIQILPETSYADNISVCEAQSRHAARSPTFQRFGAIVLLPTCKSGAYHVNLSLAA